MRSSDHEVALWSRTAAGIVLAVMLLRQPLRQYGDYSTASF